MMGLWEWKEDGVCWTRRIERAQEAQARHLPTTRAAKPSLVSAAHVLALKGSHVPSAAFVDLSSHHAPCTSRSPPVLFFSVVLSCIDP